MSKTKIEWATHTVNWLAGCTKVSPACTHCYAETMSRRMQHMPQAPDRYGGVVDPDTGRWTGVLRYDADALAGAFHGLVAAKKPRRVFVNSMSDTFHADAPPESLVDLAHRIGQIERFAQPGFPHVLMLLTKRPDRMLAWQREHFPDGLPSWVWVGCTVEDQKRANERLPVLVQVRTTVAFASVEPLLGPLNLEDWLYVPFTCGACGHHVAWYDHVGREPGCGVERCRECGSDTNLAGPPLRWVIAGGESGSNARPSHPDWFRALRDQCRDAWVPFHFKQWGAYTPGPIEGQRDGDPIAYTDAEGGFDYGALQRGRPFEALHKVGKHAAGRLLDGRTWDEVPS